MTTISDKFEVHYKLKECVVFARQSAHSSVNNNCVNTAKKSSLKLLHKTVFVLKTAKPLTLLLALTLCYANTAVAESSNHYAANNFNSHALSTSHAASPLSNEGLANRANQLRGTDINSQQHVINYHWLSEYSEDRNSIQGNKAVSKLAERHLKAYLDEHNGRQWIRQKLLPENTEKSFVKDVDYKVRVRSDRLVIGLTYEF